MTDFKDASQVKMLEFSTTGYFYPKGQEIQTPRCKFCQVEILQCIGRDAYCWICPDCIQPKDEECDG